MGSDKAFLPVDGVPMVARVVAALAAAGASDVVCIGGDRGRLERLGLSVIDDEQPGEGPLAGLVTALGWSGQGVVVLAGCDQPWLTGSLLGTLVEAHVSTEALVTVFCADGVVQPLPAVCDVAVRTDLSAALERGERALGTALRVVEPLIVETTEPDALRDVDRLEDLPPG